MDTTLNTHFSKPQTIARPCPVWLLITLAVVGCAAVLPQMIADFSRILEDPINIKLFDDDPGIQQFLQIFLFWAPLLILTWAVREGLRHEVPSAGRASLSFILLLSLVTDRVIAPFASLGYGAFLDDAIKTTGICCAIIWLLNYVALMVTLALYGIRIIRKCGGLLRFLGVVYLLWALWVLSEVTLLIVYTAGGINPGGADAAFGGMNFAFDVLLSVILIFSVLVFRRPTPADFMMRPCRAWAFTLIAACVVSALSSVLVGNYADRAFRDYLNTRDDYYNYEGDDYYDYDDNDDYGYDDDDYYGDSVTVEYGTDSLAAVPDSADCYDYDYAETDSCAPADYYYAE